mgnify:CR=1 FL=1
MCTCHDLCSNIIHILQVHWKKCPAGGGTRYRNQNTATQVESKANNLKYINFVTILI